MRLKNWVISIPIWFSTLLFTVLLYVAMLVAVLFTFFFDKKRRIPHWLCFWWSDALIALNPYWRVNVTGLENIARGRTYVIVANHQSMADIALLFQTRMQFKWVAKESLFRVPILGWCMSLVRHVRLARNNLSSIRHAYKQAETWVDKGISVMFFPEGTRTHTGAMGKFRNGAFKLACEKQIPILPIAIDGTFTVMPRGGLSFNPAAAITMTVLPVMEPEYYAATGINKFKQAAWERINNTLVESNL